jgi:ribosomal protein L19E
MDPAPRPPSPSAREAIQKASRRENTEQLSKRDALILGLNVTDVEDGRTRLNSISSNAERESNPSSPKSFTSPRPFRQVRGMKSVRSLVCFLIKKGFYCFPYYLFLD